MRPTNKEQQMANGLGDNSHHRYLHRYVDGVPIWKWRAMIECQHEQSSQKREAIMARAIKEAQERLANKTTEEKQRLEEARQHSIEGGLCADNLSELPAGLPIQYWWVSHDYKVRSSSPSL